MSTKTLDIEIKTVHLNVTALARRAGLSESVSESAQLLAFTSLVVDAVMEANGAVRPTTTGGEN